MTKERKPDLCPLCYLQDNIEEPLIYRLGSTQPLKCNKNHVYEDREALSNLTREMMDKKRSLEPKPVQRLDPTDPIKAPADAGMMVTPVDFVRISSLIGHFTDSSSLFGAIFALNQELLDTKELLRRAQDAKAVSGIGHGPGIRQLGGDAVIQLTIPERHVEQIKDIAESNGMDITRYMNARVETGLDDQWYY